MGAVGLLLLAQFVALAVPASAPEKTERQWTPPKLIPPGALGTMMRFAASGGTEAFGEAGWISDVMQDSGGRGPDTANTPKWKAGNWWSYFVAGTLGTWDIIVWNDTDRDGSFLDATQQNLDNGDTFAGVWDLVQKTEDNNIMYKVDPVTDNTFYPVNLTIVYYGNFTWNHDTAKDPNQAQWINEFILDANFNQNGQGTLNDTYYQWQNRKYYQKELATGAYTENTFENYRYSTTNGALPHESWLGGTDGYTFSGSATFDIQQASSDSSGITTFKFPISTSGGWTTDGKAKRTWSWTSSIPGQPASNGFTEYTYNVNTAVGATLESRSVRAGYFSDCYRLDRSGTIQNIATVLAPIRPPQTTTSNIGEKWWYSPMAGFIIDWNGTQPLTGYGFTYNLPPSMKDVNGVQNTDPVVITAYEDQPVSISVNVTDPDLPGGNGYGADAISFYFDATPVADWIPNKVWFDTSVPPNGTAAGVAQAVVSRDALRASEVGQYTIKVKAKDIAGVIISTNITLVVQHTNHAPYAVGKISNIAMDENSTVIVTNWTLDKKFADPDQTSGWTGAAGEKLNYSVSDNGSIMVTIDPKTQVEYGAPVQVTFQTPDYYAPTAPVKMTFKATDPYGKFATTTLNVTVVHKNHKPVKTAKAISGLAVYLKEDATASDRNATQDLKQYFDDPDLQGYPGAAQPLDALKYYVNTLPATAKWLSVKVDETKGTATIVPVANKNGEVTATFKAIDGNNDVVTVDITIVVERVNDAPTIKSHTTSTGSEDSEQTITEEESLTLTAEGDDVDILNDGAASDRQTAITYTWYITNATGEPVKQKGTGKDFNFPPLAAGTRAYTGPYSSANGPFNVTVEVGDGYATATYSWTMNVKDVNRKPKAFIAQPAPGLSVKEGTAIVLDIGAFVDGKGAYDSDETANGSLYVKWTDETGAVLAEGSAASAGVVSFITGTGGKLKAGKSGAAEHTITLVVKDKNGDATGLESDPVTVKISVTPKKKPGTQGQQPGFEAALLLVALVAAVGLSLRRRR